MKPTTIVAVLASAAGLGACGSSATSRGTSAAAGPGLSRTELAARADDICTAVLAEAATIQAPDLTAAPATAAAAYYDKIVPIVDRATKALQALIPRGDAAVDWNALVTAQVAVDRLFLRLKQKAAAGDPSGIGDISLEPAAAQKVSAAATRIGAAACKR